MKPMKKFIKNTKLKQIIIVLLLLTLFVFVSALSYVDAVSQDIANSVFRLHVIANSDSVDDQNLKLKVRDELLAYMNKISANCSSKEEVKNLAIEHENEFIEVAKRVVEESGFDYDVCAEVGLSSFPTKYYGDIALPAGTYDSLKVKIGKAKGQNWWCVMFPPLCFVDVSSGVVPESSKKEIKDSLNDEEFDLINTNQTSKVSFKFKLVEFFQNWRLGNK